MKNDSDGVKLRLVNPETGREVNKIFAIGETFSISKAQIPEDRIGGFAGDTTFPTAIVNGEEEPLSGYPIVEPDKEYKVDCKESDDGAFLIFLKEVGSDEDDE